MSLANFVLIPYSLFSFWLKLNINKDMLLHVLAFRQCKFLEFNNARSFITVHLLWY